MRLPDRWGEGACAVLAFQLLATVVALIALFAIPGHASPSRITHQYACVNLSTGRMDLQTGPRAYSFPCKRAETAISWAVNG